MRNRCIMLLLMLGVVLTFSANVSADFSTTESNPILHYSFDDFEENVFFDGSGNGYDGKLTGEPNLVSGYAGYALRFNGINNYLDLGTDPKLQPADISISFWFRRTASLLGQESVIAWAKPNGQWDGKGWYLTIKDQFHETNRPVLLMLDGNVAAYVNANVDQFYPLNEWVHIAVVLDSRTETVAIYRNGLAQDVYLTGVPKITANSDQKWIGFNSPLYNGGYLSGDLDEFYLYDIALTSEEVVTLAGIVYQEPVTNEINTIDNEHRRGILKLKPFELSQVRLLDGYFKDLKMVNANYLESLDADRLLHMFRITAGLPSNATPLGGWESPQMEIRGHSLGHFLSASALHYASTGDEEIKAKADAIVVELAKCQAAHGNGYLSAFPESVITRLESGLSVWVPWYTLHKIYAGLYDMYIYADNDLALEVLLDLTNWAQKRIDKLSDAQMEALLRVEFGGMNEVFYNLYAITNDPNHLRLAHRFDQKSFLSPLAANFDNLAGLHANTQIPKVIGAARRYELLDDPWAYNISTNFWDYVVNTRSYATGGNSVNEHFGQPNELAYSLGNTNHETCNTYNMLRLTRHLFQWSGDVSYADYYERALINGILPTMDPKTGMKMYFVPMGTGYFKVFHTHDDSFYCCTGTGIESFAKLGDSIYFQNGNALYVNLFIASTLDWPSHGVKVEQQTNFPTEEGTTLKFHCEKPVEFALHIRIPDWAVNGITVKYNGHDLEIDAEPSSYLTIEHFWHDGDTVELSFPMSLRMSALPDKKDRVALMYGPFVLAGLLGDNAMEITTTGVDVTIPTLDARYSMNLNVPEDEWESIDLWLEPVEGEELTFKTRSDIGDLIFKPFYQVFDQRYGIYWDLGQPLQAEIGAPEEEPILWYQFKQTNDGQVLDNSGKNQTGILFGDANIITVDGQGMLALEGNGYLQLPTGIMANVEQTTITTWVKVSTHRVWSRIFDFGSGPETNMFLTAQAGNSPNLRFAITNSGAAGESLFGTTELLPVGEWIHLAIVLDGAKATMHINGTEVANLSTINCYPWELGSTSHNYIGRSQYPADPNFHGFIADFRIYNRALSSDEISGVYQSRY